jgi:polynucleotide 5'-kinase involved in rRNA processing
MVAKNVPGKKKRKSVQERKQQRKERIKEKLQQPKLHLKEVKSWLQTQHFSG